MLRVKSLPKSKISKLPESFGVYLFYDKKEILYIGKAINLKKRVKNHFLRPDYKNNLFLDKVKKIKYIKTDSEIEALVLEAVLIKKHQPKYNLTWKDSKNYFYVAITKEDFPRVFITHQIKLKIDYLGPFVDGKALKQALKTLRKVFPHRSCRIMPKRPCLWYQLKRCSAPCLSKPRKTLSLQSKKVFAQTKKECQKNVKNLVKILQGKKNQVLKGLEKEMKKASALQDYEKASKTRDKIKSLEKVFAHAKIFEKADLFENNFWPEKTEKELKKILKIKKNIFRIESYDISNIQGKEATGAMITFINGKPDKNFYRRFKIKTQGKPNDIAMLKEVLMRRFGHPEWPYPDLILVDGGRAQFNAALDIMNQRKSVRPHTKIWCEDKSALISVLALAKRKNELFIQGRKKPILLKSLPREIFNLILQLRDEAHRFALDYHHKLRNKNFGQ